MTVTASPKFSLIYMREHRRFWAYLCGRFVSTLPGAPRVGLEATSRFDQLSAKISFCTQLYDEAFVPATRAWQSLRRRLAVMTVIHIMSGGSSEAFERPSASLGR